MLRQKVAQSLRRWPVLMMKTDKGKEADSLEQMNQYEDISHVQDGAVALCKI